MSRFGHSRCAQRAAFTLIELLVVISIISILMGLLMKGVQGAKESARRITCLNNLSQIGKAGNMHLEKWQIYPTGGWGWNWIGDPDRGFDRRQPGGWNFALLPFMDLETLRDHGKGLPENEKKTAILEVARMPVISFICPTRRRAVVYPNQFSSVANNAATPTPGNNMVARSDYAANSGSQSINEYFGGPGSVSEGDTRDWDYSGKIKCNGISFERSEISQAMVYDGTSFTILAGEKYLNPDDYLTGKDAGDNESLYTGFNNDNFRLTAANKTFLRDRPGLGEGQYRFGGPHASGCNFVFCDGSTRSLSYGMDPDVFALLGQRNDEQKLNTGAF